MAEKQEVKPKAEKSDNLMSNVYMGTAEKTHAKTAVDADSQIYPYNPDDLVTKVGDYTIYEEMLHDDQVSANMQIKKDIVLGSGFHFVEEDESQEEIKEDLEQALLEDVNIPFDEQLEELITSYDFGFSLSEKIFKKRDDGSLTFRYCKTRHPNSWLIHVDDFGNVEKYEQQGVDSNHFPNPNSLIHVINKRKFSNPFGTSDLRAAYQAYVSKRHITRYYAMFIEKHASPTPVGRYDKNAPQSAVDKFFAVLKKFQNKTALVVPKEMEIEFLESKSEGEAFIKGIDLFNTFIGRSLLIPDLLGFSGSETTGGSFALGKEQMRLFFLHIARRRNQLESIVNKEIVWPIVLFNWGDIPNYPKFKFNPISDEDIERFAKLWIDATRAKVFKPNPEEINHFRNMVNFPEGEVLENEPEPSPFDPSNPLDKNKDKNPDDKNPSNGKEEPDKKIDKAEDDKKNSDKEKKSFAKVFPQVDGSFHKKVDFKAASNLMDSRKDKILNDVRPIVNMIFDDLAQQIEKKKIVQNRNVGRIDSIKLKHLGKLQQNLKRNLREAHQDGMQMARNEVSNKKDFANEPVPADEFLQVIDDETFQYVGKDWEYQVTKDARIAMNEAIKSGKPLSSVLQEVGLNKEKSLVSIERYARTKTTEVMNRGRKEFFDSTGVVDGYQYSAILDSRTSPICDGLHGKKFVSGTEPTPPLHFNCRSLLIPITMFEEFTPDTRVGSKPIDNFIEDNKGKGFPTR